jgi:hypothetical protein
MAPALTSVPWLAVLDRIYRGTGDATTAELARMLWEIVNEANDTTVAQILDRHALKLMGTL